MKQRHKIAYYVTAHGYGHGVRSTDILRALRSMYPDVDVTLVTDLPRDFLQSRLPRAGISFRSGAFDVGMVQLDSVKVDLPATRGKVEALYAHHDTLIDSEHRFLRDGGFSAVVADIPAIPLEAAVAAGLPRVAVGNFGWDWIYEEFAQADAAWQPYVDVIRAGYAKADLLLRLPFSEPMAAFPRRMDLPLVASPGRAQREMIASMTGADPRKTWVLLSFTSLDWDDAALKQVAKLKRHAFFTVRPLEWQGTNLFPIDRERVSFADVVASCDIVVSKPGFGILSECAVNRKPLVYTERTDFREYAVLVQSIEKFLRHQHIPGERLYRGDLGPALEAVASAPEPPRSMKAGGDQVAAQQIARLLR